MTSPHPRHSRIVRIPRVRQLPLHGDNAAGGTIAPGFRPRPDLNLAFLGGRTLPHMSFKNFFLGADGWSPSDMANINGAISGALSDPHLNNVISQYFPHDPDFDTTFLGSLADPAACDNPFTRDSVDTVLGRLLGDGAFAGMDFDNTVICLLLPPGVVLTTDRAGGGGMRDDDDGADSSTEGLGGYHGSTTVSGQRIYYAVGVYSEETAAGQNGIIAWPDSWKNVVATFYHELNEARTDPDVEQAPPDTGGGVLGWYSHASMGAGQGEAGEIGDIPMAEATTVQAVMVEVALVAGGTAPIQLMWSNAVGGPQGPFA